MILPDAPIDPSEDSDFDPEGWDTAAADRSFALGIERFDAGRYEEAHEAFEKLWLSTQGPDSDFYKGLVQASIALHHFREGNLEGAAKLHSGHRSLLAPYLPKHHGIDLAVFLREMQDVLGPVVRRRPDIDPRFDPERRPRLRRT